jgi:predicted lipoprotein with Yx(FWY)xxD motif
VRRLAAALIVALALASCGGGGSSSTSGSTAEAPHPAKTTPPPPKPPPNAEEGSVFVSLGSAAGLGEILVDSEGHTLYAFSNDSTSESTCEGACAKAWPPLLIAHGEPHPSNGAGASRLGTLDRADGTRQVTYAGHPLYSYSGDKQPGEANGDGSAAFGGTWTPLKGSGAPAG